MPSLRTIFCHSSLDLYRIISTRPELRIIGLYSASWSDETRIIPCFAEQSHNPCLPTVFKIQHYRSMVPVFNHITFFPSFYSLEQVQDMCRDIAVSDSAGARLKSLRSHAYLSDAHIFLKDLSTASAYIEGILKGMNK